MILFSRIKTKKKIFFISMGEFLVKKKKKVGKKKRLLTNLWYV